MKRVLLVSYVFPPMVSGGAPRLSQFAKYLPQFGWAPTVLTVPYREQQAIDERTLAELPEEVEIVRAWSPLERAAPRGKPQQRRGLSGTLHSVARWSVRMACTPDRQIFWYPFAVRAGRAALARKNYDAIFASYGPATNLLVGHRLARESKLPLVADFRDLWSDYPGAKWATPLHRLRAARLEKRIARFASKLIGVSPQMAQHLAQKHQRSLADVVSITNGFDPADFPKATDLRPPETTQPFCLCYTGSVYGAYDFTPLFQAVGDLARDQTISPETFRLRFVGNLATDEPAHWGISAFVDTQPPVPHEQVFAILGRADALLMLEGPGYWANFSYAVKVFDYALTGKPVLALVEPGGNSARLLQELGVGEIVATRSRSQIAAALRRLLAGRRRPIPVDITQPPLCHFNRHLLTQRLAGVLDSVSGQKPQASQRAFANRASACDA